MQPGRATAFRSKRAEASAVATASPPRGTISQIDRNTSSTAAAASAPATAAGQGKSGGSHAMPPDGGGSAARRAAARLAGHAVARAAGRLAASAALRRCRWLGSGTGAAGGLSRDFGGRQIDGRRGPLPAGAGDCRRAGVFQWPCRILSDWAGSGSASS